MARLLLVLASLSLTAIHAQLNPLGRFGRCINVPTQSIDESDMEGTWYLQYRPDNPDHYVHTCQAQYDHETTDGILHSLLYFYNKNKPVNAPQHIKYQKLGPGKYHRGITVDEHAVYVKMNIIDYNKELNSRVLYYCVDSPLANPDIYNVQIATVEQVPANLASVLAAGKTKLQAASPRLAVPLMQVEQSLAKCAPLVVSPAAKEKLFG